MPSDNPVLPGMFGAGGPSDAHDLTRTGDPETSHAAGAAIAPDAGTIRQQVLGLLRDIGPMMDDQLIAAYRNIYGPVRESTIRTRRSELVTRNLVEWTGTTGETAAGRASRIWKAVSVGND